MYVDLRMEEQELKIIKGADRSEVHWTSRKVVEMLDGGEINPDLDIQRGYVWKNNDKKSALIRSMILDRAVPPFYFNKINDVYEVEDGKQRILTVSKFLKDEFELSGLDLIQVINDDGQLEEFDINGLKFSELLDCFQNAIKEYNFTISFTDEAEADEVADTFYNLNSGQALNSATMNRVKAKSKEQIINLGKHRLFKEALSTVALEGHVNDDLVGKTHAVLNEEEPCMNAAWIRKYMMNAKITREDEKDMIKVFDRICNIHDMIEDKKIAKRIYTKTHMISIVPVVLNSIHRGLTDKQMMEWFVEFFSGKKSPTISSSYNSTVSSGSGRKEAVKKRLEAVEKSYNKYFSNIS